MSTTEYHYHDTGPGRWYERIIGDNRYTVCAGPDIGAGHARHCHVIHVASTIWGARRIVAREERRRRRTPFYEYPATRIEP